MVECKLSLRKGTDLYALELCVCVVVCCVVFLSPGVDLLYMLRVNLANLYSKIGFLPFILMMLVNE